MQTETLLKRFSNSSFAMTGFFKTKQLRVFPNTSSVAGYTLLELLVGMAASTLLISGLSSALYISSHSLNLDNRPARQSSIAAAVLADIVADLQYAISFRERTATAITFQVPDRTGDSKAETIRYAWSGTPGDPLTYQYNGGTVQIIAEDVQQFNLASTTRLLQP